MHNTASPQDTVEHIGTPLDIARQNFAAWNAAVQSGDPTTVASLYTEDAAFLPTMEATKRGRAGAEEYFAHFLAKNPTGNIVEDTVQCFGDDAIVHSGLYDFELGPENNRQVAHARFTFVWTRVGDEWKISHHHSSVVPHE